MPLPLHPSLTTPSAHDGGHIISASSGSHAENCARIRDMGFATLQHVKMYGERLELTSDPFDEDGYTSVHALSGNDPTVRTIRLPVAILTGLAGHFRHD